VPTRSTMSPCNITSCFFFGIYYDLLFSRKGKNESLKVALDTEKPWERYVGTRFCDVKDAHNFLKKCWVPPYPGYAWRPGCDRHRRFPIHVVWSFAEFIILTSIHGCLPRYLMAPHWHSRFLKLIKGVVLWQSG
jgi:hypothetical protein